MERDVYLLPNVVIEPLIDRWYAWSHLINPATASLNILERHIKIMESYIMAPEIHAQAVKSPKMRGGPFMDIKGKRVDEIKELLQKTMADRSEMLQLARSIRELNNLLQAEAKGHSLEKMYDKVPEKLKGLVELYYDLHNHPGFRFFESLLYKTPYYDKRSQSIALWLTNNDHRPFCLSTPRLPDPDIIQLQIPFDHQGINELAKMKRTAGKLNQIKQLLNISPEQETLFETFFTTEAPPKYSKYNGNKIRMRYFGHACILIETKNISVLVDPLISYYGYDSDITHFSDLHLPETIDYVLITHNHQDHVLFETLLPLRHRIKKMIIPGSRNGRLEDPDLKLILNNVGFENVFSIHEMETIGFADAQITGLPFTGEHSDLNILSKLCYLVEIGGFKLMFLADSRIVEPALYKYIQQEIGQMDVIFMGMECDGAPLSWLYGPLMPVKIARDQDESRRLSGSDYSRGMPLISIFNPSEVYVYAMGQEPWVEFISSVKYTDESNPIVQSNLLVQECLKKGIIAERLYGEKEILYEKKVRADAVLLEDESV